jgi:hypothetical protein
MGLRTMLLYVPARLLCTMLMASLRRTVHIQQREHGENIPELTRLGPAGMETPDTLRAGAGR